MPERKKRGECVEEVIAEDRERKGNWNKGKMKNCECGGRD